MTENKFGCSIDGKYYGLVELKHAWDELDEPELNASEMAQKMSEWDYKQWALFAYLSQDLTLVEEISDLDIDTDEISIDGEDLLILTDSEADDRWEEELDSYLDDCIYPEIPECYRRYFDEERWKDDARYDGRGHAIARYDGHENEFKIDDEWIYIYRM